MTEDPDPCQLFRDAVAESDIQVSAALQLLADRVQDLMNCEMEHSGAMAVPGMQMRAQEKRSRLKHSLRRIQHHYGLIKHELAAKPTGDEDTI